jgi:hypothetical protein
MVFFLRVYHIFNDKSLPVELKPYFLNANSISVSCKHWNARATRQDGLIQTQHHRAQLLAHAGSRAKIPDRAQVVLPETRNAKTRLRHICRHTPFDLIGRGVRLWS